MNPSLASLRTAVSQKYGDSIEPYGGSDDEGNSMGFRIKGIEATFSVIAIQPPGNFDVQIENFPPGDYVFNRVLTAEEFMDLIEKYRKPMEEWPWCGH